VRATATGTLTNTVRVATPAGLPDLDTSNNAATDTDRVVAHYVVAGAGRGHAPLVQVYSVSGGLVRSFLAYDAGFTGGVSVAAGDVNGDGIDDIITGAGPGGTPHVRVVDGRTSATVRNFLAYTSNFHGGVFVAAGDLTGDRVADIITGAGPGGGPHLRAFDGRTLAPLQSFFAF